MRIAYFTSHVYGPDFGLVLPNAPKPNPAGQNFHELLIRALAQFASVDVYSYVPWMLDLEEKDFTAESNITYHYVKTSTNKIVRAFFGSMKLKRRASKNPCDIVFFDSLNRSAAKAAIAYASAKRVPSVAVLTDHPSNVTGISESYANSIIATSSKATACYALTPGLAQTFGFSNKRQFIRPVLVEEKEIKKHEHQHPYIYFAGALFEKDGLGDLIEAYEKTRPDYDLVIAGHGPYEKEIVEAASKDPRILFLGQIDKREHLGWLAGSALAINPRRYKASIDKFAVPSKVMEYLCYAPYIASTLSTPLKDEFEADINWLDEGTLAFFESSIGKDKTFVSLKENRARTRIFSQYGISKTAEDLQEFLAKLGA